MERIIANRLVWYLEKSNLFNDAQSGYRKARSTLDQLSRLNDSVNKSINNKGFTVGIFLNFSRAYDMLWIVERWSFIPLEGTEGGRYASACGVVLSTRFLTALKIQQRRNVMRIHPLTRIIRGPSFPLSSSGVR